MSVNIPNVHPSHRGNNATFDNDDNRSIKDRFESFVGSYSRTSMMHMAENVLVGDGSTDDDEEEDNYSTYSTSGRYQRRSSEGTLNERSSLLYPSLQKVNTGASVLTVADTYHQEVASTTVKKSSFLQSVFNSINILIGVGILALPLGFKNAGWACGIFIFIFCFGLTNYTAKLLAKCLDYDPSSRTYGDMGASAFGMKGRWFISCLFFTELITCSVALVVLLSDGIDSLFPGHDYILIRVISYIILTPTLFIPVRHLSYTSLLGILSIFSLIAVILFDGLSKPHAPGSLHEMADTSVLPIDWLSVPMSFGLIMAGFAGHAVFPTIYRDMKAPRQYKQMVNFTYVVTALVYLIVAASGYIMFGSSTMQEITQNLVLVPEYNQALNKLAVWLIALNPIAKYGLTLNPIILSWKIGLTNNASIDHWMSKSSWRKPLINMIGILSTSAIIVILAIVLPNFDQIMSLLGAFFSFLISGIFPIMCNLKLFGNSQARWERILNYTLLSLASTMAILGTLRSFI